MSVHVQFMDLLGYSMFSTPLQIFAITCLVLFSGCSNSANEPIGEDNPKNTSEISFRQDIKPILVSYNCTHCHGGTSGLVVESVPHILTGGDHGPAVIPGNADSSLLVKKMSPNPPFGLRMPRDGPYLPEKTIELIKVWINQGAKDN